MFSSESRFSSTWDGMTWVKLHLSAVVGGRSVSLSYSITINKRQEHFVWQKIIKWPLQAAEDPLLWKYFLVKLTTTKCESFFEAKRLVLLTFSLTAVLSMQQRYNSHS